MLLYAQITPCRHRDHDINQHSLGVSESKLSRYVHTNDRIRRAIGQQNVCLAAGAGCPWVGPQMGDTGTRNVAQEMKQKGGSSPMGWIQASGDSG